MAGLPSHVKTSDGTRWYLPEVNLAMLGRMSPKIFIMLLQTSNRDHGHEKYRTSILLELYVFMLKLHTGANRPQAIETLIWRKWKEVSIRQPFTALFL